MSYMKTDEHDIHELMCDACTDRFPVDSVTDSAANRLAVDTEAAKFGWKAIDNVRLFTVSHYCSKDRCTKIATRNLSEMPSLRQIA